MKIEKFFDQWTQHQKEMIERGNHIKTAIINTHGPDVEIDVGSFADAGYKYLSSMSKQKLIRMLATDDDLVYYGIMRSL